MKRILLFIFAFFIWCLIVWPYDFTARELNWQMLVIGGAASLLVSIMPGPVFQKYGKKHTRTIFMRIVWGIVYIPVLFFYIFIANLDVLYRIIHPKMPIHPGIVKVKTDLKTDTGRTILANSITLTPGTLSVDITENGFLFIHCINMEHKETAEERTRIISRFEKIITRVFE